MAKSDQDKLQDYEQAGGYGQVGRRKTPYAPAPDKKPVGRRRGKPLPEEGRGQPENQDRDQPDTAEAAEPPSGRSTITRKHPSKL